MWDKYDDAVTLFNKLYELFENDKIVQADFTNWGDISSDPYFIFEAYKKNMRLIVEHMSYHRIRITFRRLPSFGEYRDGYCFPLCFTQQIYVWRPVLQTYTWYCYH